MPKTMKQILSEKHQVYVAGAMADFQKLLERDYQKALDFAFEACGCEVAYPTWWMREDGSTERVDCLHLSCRIRRREFVRPDWLVRFTASFRGELDNGWLRFSKETPQGRRSVARLYWAMKRKKKFNIMACVYAGVLA